MNNSNFSQPLFAPAHSSAAAQNTTGGDELDFNEIFAEYFINEFDDPMNAYTSTMGNFSGGGVNAALQQQAAAQGSAAAGDGGGGGGGAQVPLPTGGIRTTFHSGPPAPAAAEAPEVKKPKVEVSAEQQMQAMFSAQQQQLQQQQVAGGAVPQQQQQAAFQGTGGVTLPVGHGIRLGGAPAGSQVQHVVWGQQQAGVVGGAPAGGGGGGGGGGPSEQAVQERRQRNREHAKRSRVRKKFMLESLQGEVQELQRENQHLRMLVQEHIPENPQQIIAECCSSNPLFSDDDPNATSDAQKAEEDAGQKRKAETLVKADFSLMQSLTFGQQCFVLSDPKLPDNPIVFASPGFYKLTGYTSKEVLGRNCRFLQGPGTNPKAVEVLKKSIAAGTDCTVCLLNYKADGTPFWNQLFVAALRDSDNCIVNYVGVQTEVEPDAGANALEDKVNEVLPLANKDETKDQK